MKISYLIVAFLITISTFSFAAESNKPSKGSGSAGGWRESYGGDATILEFKYFAKEVNFILVTHHFSNSFGLDQTVFSQAIDASNVECAKNLELDGVSKDAINFPNENPQKILLDCEKWKTFSSQEKYILAIHEYLPLSGIDDTSYKYASEIYGFFNLNKFNQEENVQRLMDAAFDCNEAAFDRFVAKKGNVFMVTNFKLNALHTATVSGCTAIIKKLIDLGVTYQPSSSLTPAAHYLLVHYSFISKEKNIKDRAITSLEALVTTWPEIVNMGFENLNWASTANFNAFPQHCYKGSTVMHLIASACQTDKLFCDAHYVRALSELGFSLDKKNACGETPRDLFKKTDMELE